MWIGFIFIAVCEGLKLELFQLDYDIENANSSYSYFILPVSINNKTQDIKFKFVTSNTIFGDYDLIQADKQFCVNQTCHLNFENTYFDDEAYF